MARRSLKPQLNQIRAWVREGRTDAWIAHQLDISASELREFRKQHDLAPDDEEAGTGEVDLRDEIEAEVEAATAEETEEDEEEEVEEEAEEEEKPAKRERKGQRGGRRSGGRQKDSAGDSDSEDSDADDSEEGGEGEGESGGGQRRRRRRRGRRGGRGRRREMEATFDHGERDGYGLWLDAAIKENPVYTEHWAGKREVTVRIEADQIVIRRAGSGDGDGDSSDD